MPPSAHPPNVTSAATTPNTPANTASERISTTKSNTNGSTDITSPHELTEFVDKLLERLDTRFDELSSQILDRMEQMSTRVDALEASLQDVITGDITIALPAHAVSAPASPARVAQEIQRSKSHGNYA